MPRKSKAVKVGEVDRVYRLLKGWLVECDLAPGDVLSEVDLARRCDTSRTPVREACSRLTQDGWIRRIPHKGFLVAPVSVKDLLQTYEYRKLLECFAAEKAAQVAGPEQIEKLARIVEPEKDPRIEATQIIPLSDLFHMAIAEIAGNQRVIDQLRLTLEYVHRLSRFSAKRDRSWIPHGEILAATEARKPTEAQRAMSAHIDCARDHMLRLFAA